MNRIECPLEQLLREAGYVQTYDGQITKQRAGDPTSLQPEDRRFFVRYYQQVNNNHFIDKYAKLVYDLRTGWCIECNIYRKAPNGARQEQKMFSNGNLTKR